MTTAHSASHSPVTLRSLQRMAQSGQPFACLTAYDATTARWLAKGGVHVLLVGDTAAEVILGFDRTIDMPLEILIALTAAVKRGAPEVVVMADMPFMSYQADESEGIQNAGRFLVEGRADIVKVEADESFAPLIGKMTRAGIPVCAHVGSLPQRAGLTSGYVAAGRTAAQADQIVRDAVALERAGAVMLLAEAVSDEVTATVMEATSVPLIGIGAGPACHGQVLVVHDLLGLSDTPPRFAAPVASMGPAVQDAAAQWVARVAARDLGGTRYTMKAGEAGRLGAGGGAAKVGPVPGVGLAPGKGR